MSKIIEKYEARIKKGIALLDKKLGRKKWSKKIDVAELNLGSTMTCVLGEVFGSYSEGLEEVGLEGEDGELYGFNSDNNSLLTSLWIGVLYKLGIKG